MANSTYDDSERFRRLSALGRIGWWEADFSSKQYLCSEYVRDLFGIKGDTLSFEEFYQMIREDYRVRIAHEFAFAQNLDVYEQTFPINSAEGVVWVHSRVGYKERLPNGEPIRTFGVLQRVEAPENEREKAAAQRVNDLLYRQNSISHSLFRFLKDEEMGSGIYDILKDILDFFHGGRVYIFEYDEDYQYQDCTYEVVAPGVDPQIDTLQKLSTESIPWWTTQILKQKPILLESLSQLPEEASEEYEVLFKQNIKSLMVVPLVTDHQVWGYMGVDLVDRHVLWSNEDYQWLNSLANIVSICIELRKAKDEAVRERSFLGNLFRYMPLGYVRMSVVCGKENKPCDYRLTDANQILSDFLGTEVSQYVGKMASTIYSDVTSKLQLLIEILESGMHKELDLCFERTGRLCHVVLYSPEKNEVVALFLDTTETIQAHQALDRSEKLFRNIFTNIPAGVEIYDKDGYMVDINNEDMEIFGVRDKSDVIGVNLFMNPNLPPQLIERIRTEDSVDFRLDYSFEHTDGYYPATKSGIINLYTKISKIYDYKPQNIM